MKPILSSTRLSYFVFTPEDVNDLLLLHADIEVNRYLEPQSPWTLEHVQARLEGFIRHQREFGFSKWRVCLHDGVFVGRAGLETWPETGEFELGYSFRRECWGQGYATEATRAILNWTFENTDLNAITAMAAMDNTASRRVLEKSGLRSLKTRTINAIQYAAYQITRDEHRLEEETHG
jgi:[ribosomal protein S5]-alanine N-acetyltransferase